MRTTSDKLTKGLGAAAAKFARLFEASPEDTDRAGRHRKTSRAMGRHAIRPNGETTPSQNDTQLTVPQEWDEYEPWAAGVVSGRTTADYPVASHAHGSSPSLTLEEDPTLTLQRLEVRQLDDSTLQFRIPTTVQKRPFGDPTESFLGDPADLPSRVGRAARREATKAAELREQNPVPDADTLERTEGYAIVRGADRRDLDPLD